ncbi:MAG: hypothetical protein Q4G40_12525 [Brachybacterium sp.]|nr:hypothetical protein [Brachybacterium sp.]
MRVLAPALRLILPALWMGLIIGLSFIEAPLKFQAPGITTPLGLGIGRLVFTALSIAGALLLAAIVLTGLARPRENRAGWLLIAGIAAVTAVQSLVIRPPLNARSDVIIAGGDPGESWLHYGYIAAEAVLLLLLLGYLIHAARRLPAE